jgi:kinase-associated protein B
MFAVGDKVIAEYKSGEYIGEIIELTPSNKLAVRIASVMKHPDQGDLHHPMQGDAQRFMQRRALAFGEIALIVPHNARPYEGHVPAYEASLKDSVDREKRRLEQLALWAKRSLVELEGLEKDYGFVRD